MAARNVIVRVATRGDASMAADNLSAGIACECVVVLDFETEMEVHTVALWQRHFPINDIDVAERFAVYLSMHMLIQVWVKHRIRGFCQAHGVELVLPILLHTDRQCLQTTLLGCPLYNSYERELARFYELRHRPCTLVQWERRDSQFMSGINIQAQDARNLCVAPVHLNHPDLWRRLVRTSSEVEDTLCRMAIFRLHAHHA